MSEQVAAEPQAGANNDAVELQNTGAAPGADGAAPNADAQQPENPNAPGDDGQGAKPPVPEHRKASYRFAEMSRQTRELEIQLAEERGRRMALEQGREAPKPQPSLPAPKDGPPSPDDYDGGEYNPRYAVDLAKYEFRQEQVQAEARKAEAVTFEAGKQRFVETVSQIDTLAQEWADTEHAPVLYDGKRLLVDLARNGRTDIVDAVTATGKTAGWVMFNIAADRNLLNDIVKADPVTRGLLIGELNAEIKRALSAPAAQPAPSSQPAPSTHQPSPQPTPQANGRGALPNPGNPPEGDMTAYRQWRERAFAQ